MALPNLKNKFGYAALEIIFYIGIFAILTVAVIDSLSTMTKAFKETEISSHLVESSLIMERISREIRQAEDINYLSPSAIGLDTRDDLENYELAEFILSGYNLEFREDGDFVGNLNSSNVEIITLSFTNITTTTGKAVKITLVTRSSQDPSGRTASFENTIVLRGIYAN